LLAINQQTRGPAGFCAILDQVGGRATSETRKIAAILVADIVGYSRLAGADEDRTLARLRALRSDLIDPTIAVYNGRIVKRTGDGGLIEFRSVVDAVRCAIEVSIGGLDSRPLDNRPRAACGTEQGRRRSRSFAFAGKRRRPF
jgi:class 3 adenylate cyclase